MQGLALEAASYMCQPFPTGVPTGFPLPPPVLLEGLTVSLWFISDTHCFLSQPGGCGWVAPWRIRMRPGCSGVSALGSPSLPCPVD